MIYKRILNRLNSEYTIFKARVHRKNLGGVRFVGITGSAGKTTVKDLVAAILSEDGPCSRTSSSRNELFFVAETVNKTRKSDKYAVIEIHEGHPGAMDKPLKLLKPQLKTSVTTGV